MFSSTIKFLSAMACVMAVAIAALRYDFVEAFGKKGELQGDSAEVQAGYGAGVGQVRENAVHLSVFSFRDGDPVSGVSARLLSKNWQGQTFQGDRDGQVHLEWTTQMNKGPLAVVFEAEGFSRRLLRFPRRTQFMEVALYPSGSLMIEITDGQGMGVPGVEIKLMPPTKALEPWGDSWKDFQPAQLGWGPEEAGKWFGDEAGAASPPLGELLGGLPGEPLRPVVIKDIAQVAEVFRDCLPKEGWTQRTDANGRVRWEGLPAMRDYQWGTPDLSGVLFDPDPLPDFEESEDGSLVQKSGPAVRNLSGPFQLKQDRVVELRATFER